MKEKTQIEKVSESSFAIVKRDPDHLIKVLDQAFAQNALSRFDLERLRIPGGGGLAWELPTLEGVDVQPHFDAVILATKGNEKVWWRQEFGDGQAGPPDCSSHDGISGLGWNETDEPPSGFVPVEHDCASCPWGQWNSDRRGGAGKDCKDIGLLFLMREETFLPSLLVMPPTSLKPMRTYLTQLLSRGLTSFAVVTRFGLEKTKSGGGIDYSVLAPQFVREIDGQEIERFKVVSDYVRQYLFEAVTIESRDITGG